MKTLKLLARLVLTILLIPAFILAIPVMLILQAISSITGSKTITESQIYDNAKKELTD